MCLVSRALDSQKFTPASRFLIASQHYYLPPQFLHLCRISFSHFTPLLRKSTHTDLSFFNPTFQFRSCLCYFRAPHFAFHNLIVSLPFLTFFSTRGFHLYQLNASKCCSKLVCFVLKVLLSVSDNQDDSFSVHISCEQEREQSGLSCMMRGQRSQSLTIFDDSYLFRSLYQVLSGRGLNAL